jgi:dipeptidyl aminopeptidase/acylaminoacyl peptidase
VVNTEEIKELVADCPTLYHMAALGSWPSIREKGLLSTSALLDLYQVTGAGRHSIEEERRDKSVVLAHAGLPRAVVRDQLPMTDAGLVRCLPKHLAPADWYKLLNQKTFFWLTRSRLVRLLSAGTFRNESHDVLEVDTKKILDDYFDKIWLCPMNSGSTKPMPHPRDENTFRRIPDYPYSDWRRKRARGERAVELVVDHGVPDISKYVTRVVEMRGDKENRTIYTR